MRDRGICAAAPRGGAHERGLRGPRVGDKGAAGAHRSHRCLTPTSGDGARRCCRTRRPAARAQARLAGAEAVRIGEKQAYEERQAEACEALRSAAVRRTVRMREEHMGEVSRWAGRMSAAKAGGIANLSLGEQADGPPLLHCPPHLPASNSGGWRRRRRHRTWPRWKERARAWRRPRRRCLRCARRQPTASSLEQAAAEAMSAARAAAMSEEAQAHARKREAATAAELERWLVGGARRRALVRRRAVGVEAISSAASRRNARLPLRELLVLRRCFVALRLNARRST